MIAHAAAHLSPAAVTEAGRVFVVPAPFLPWLGPVLILAGVALQLAALARCRRGQGARLAGGTALLCAAGAFFVFAGAALDRDVAVGVGEALALAGIWFAWRKA